MKIDTASGNKRNTWANIRVRRRQESKWKKAACLPVKRGGGGAGSMASSMDSSQDWNLPAVHFLILQGVAEEYLHCCKKEEGTAY